MFEKLEIFRAAQAMAMHAGARQSVIARNMANADTPGYAARDIMPFQAILESDSGEYTTRVTRPTHLSGSHSTQQPDVIERQGAVADPNGNSVSLETEMIHAVAVKRQHDQALAIYKSSLGIIRAAIGRR